MHRLKIALTFLFVLSVSVMSFAQKSAVPFPKAEDVLARFIEVTGGADAYKKIESRMQTAEITIEKGGISGDITSSTLSDGSFYEKMELGGGTTEAGSDGTTYWSTSSYAEPRIIEGAERDMLAMQNLFTSMLHPEKYFNSMKVTAVEKVGEEDCYRMEKVKKDGDTQADFYSIKTGLMVKTLMTSPPPPANFKTRHRVVAPRGKVEIELLFSDYRKVGDILISHTQKRPGNMATIVTIEKIELNTELPKEMFALPEAVQKLLAKKAKEEAKTAKEAVEEPAP